MPQKVSSPQGSNMKKFLVLETEKNVLFCSSVITVNVIINGVMVL